MMRRAGVAAVLCGELSACSHAFVVKHDRHITAGTGSDESVLDQGAADEDTAGKFLSSHHSSQYFIADLDDDRMMLVTDLGEGSALDSHEGIIADEVSLTLSPRARQNAHAAQFEAEFKIHLNMTQAHATGMPMGLELSFDTDYQPVSVSKVKKNGLVEEWNTANPGNDVHVGDEIVQVNSIQWHHNTPDFVKRISGQFKAGRKLTAGANELLTLYIQRPKQQSHKRFPAQREDAHHKAYPVEFDAKLTVLPLGLPTSASENEVMGWELYAKNDWDPVSIGNVTSSGAIAAYNRANPDRAIMAGDEIVKVNEVAWHHSAKIFRQRIAQKCTIFRRQASGSEPLVLSIRRPAAVHQAAEAAKDASLAAAQGRVDPAQSSAAPEPTLKSSGPSEERVRTLAESLQAATDRVGALSAERSEVVQQLSQLVRRKANISAELAAAEEAQEELEAERDEALRRAAPAEQPGGAPGAGSGAVASAPPAQTPPGASEEDGRPAPPGSANDGGAVGASEGDEQPGAPESGDDVIGASEGGDE
ncbi:unnamed protein product [Prorocentrum cordatum]|uniref:PDZ domain-containing protein n=1 Tax=Prorocentrum cordatum TaxID=2364126 RepID=A0ABN9QTL3_9DINO|nr:unnamed protein product [Polarella glacialis]